MKDAWKHIKFIATYPKLGPDMYFTHWLLFFKPLRLWYQKRILKERIGKNSEIRPYCILNGYNNIVIGNNVIIPEGVRLVTDPFDNKKIVIGNAVLFGPNVAVYATTHTFQNTQIPIKNQVLKNAHTEIKSGSWIGINVVILPGVTIGCNTVIAANSVVTKDIPDNVVAGGCPAKVLKQIG